MANGGLEKLMGNPMLRNMMEGMQNGGGMPDMSQVSHISLFKPESGVWRGTDPSPLGPDQLMNDPTMREMAEKFKGSM